VQAFLYPLQGYEELAMLLWTSELDKESREWLTSINDADEERPLGYGQLPIRNDTSVSRLVNDRNLQT
jgi:hypothetical protein